MSTPETPNSHLPPVPRYGEYAPPGHVPPVEAPQPYVAQGPGPAYYAQPGERPRRTWDLVLSIVLLVIGVFGVLIAIVNAFTIDTQMEQLYAQYGVAGEYSSGPSAAIAQAVIVVSHLVLYVLAAVLTAVLLRKRRIAFWLPLSIGALAAIIFMVTLVVLALTDPVLFDAAMQQQGQ